MTTVPPLPPTAPPGGKVTRAFRTGVFVVTLVIFFACIGILHRTWSSEVSRLERQLEKEKGREAELAAVAAQNANYQRLLRELEVRIDVIQELRGGIISPEELMTAIVKVANRRPEVSICAVTGEGGRLVLRAQSDSVGSAANFLAWLESTHEFSDVRLRQFYQDNGANRQSYKFDLDCVYSPAQPAKSNSQAGAPAGKATPARGRSK